MLAPTPPDTPRNPQRRWIDASVRRYFEGGRDGAFLLADYDGRTGRSRRRESAASEIRNGRVMLERFLRLDAREPYPTSWTTIGTSTTPVTNGALGTWPTAGLTGVYTLRLIVEDQLAPTSAAHQTVVTATVYLDNGRRGDAPFLTRVPFDLAGGYQLSVGVANGEATLSRSLFSIPSYGPPQALDLTYSSLEATSAGLLGSGWTSNLSQYLTFESGFVVWHGADGGRVPFGNVAGSWTALPGHFETLSHGTGTYTVTLKDQTQLTFADAAPGRLTRIANRFGKALTLAWGGSSATATDASGRATNIAIDAANGRITDVTDSAGRHWGFGYDASGNLTSITDPLADVTTLGYDGSHELTSVARVRHAADGSHPTITWTVGYTGGRATSVADPIGGPSVADTFTYNTGNTVVGLLKTYSPVARNTSDGTVSIQYGDANVDYQDGSLSGSRGPVAISQAGRSVALGPALSSQAAGGLVTDNTVVTTSPGFRAPNTTINWEHDVDLSKLPGGPPVRLQTTVHAGADIAWHDPTAGPVTVPAWELWVLAAGAVVFVANSLPEVIQ